MVLRTFITGGIKQWIRHGEWAKDTLDAEFDYIINRDKAITPEEKVRMNRLLDLDTQLFLVVPLPLTDSH
jgi:uncharacterized protein (DUF2132 family)